MHAEDVPLSLSFKVYSTNRHFSYDFLDFQHVPKGVSVSFVGCPAILTAF